MPYPIQWHTIQVSPYFPGCAGPWRPTSLHLEALWPHQSPSCKFKHFSRVFWGLLYISYHTDSWILLTEYASTASKIPNNVFHFLAKTCIAGLCYWHEKYEIVFFFLQKKKIPAAATAWHDLSILIFHGSFNLCPSILPVILLKEKHALSWNLRQRYFWPSSWAIMDKRTTQRKAKVGKYRMSWEMRMSFCHRDELC